jgi:hypothetical protein
MSDLVFTGVTVGFFFISVMYVYGCRSLKGGGGNG